MSDDGLKTVYKAYNVLPKPCGDEKSIGTFYGKIASIQGRVEPFQKTEDGYDSKYKFVPRAVLQTRYHDEMKKENLWVKKGLGDVFEATFHGEKRLFAQFYYIVGDTSGNSSRTDTYIMLDGYIHKYDSAGKRYLRSVQGTHEIAIAVSWGERVAMRLFWGYAEQDDEAPPISKEVPLTQEDLASEGKLKVIVLNDNAKKYWRGNVDKLVKIEVRYA